MVGAQSEVSGVGLRGLVNRWLFPDLRRLSQPRLLLTVAWVGVLTVALLAGLFISHKALAAWPVGWIAAPVVTAALLSRARFVEAEALAVRLLKVLGLVGGLYCLFHYPLLPALPGNPESQALYAGLLVLWVGAVASGALCLWVPALGVLPPTFLVWSRLVAGTITGLPHGSTLDVAPMSEVAMCLGVGLLISQAYGIVRPRDEDVRREFVRTLLVLAISVHLANYFWSFMAKVSLPGPEMAWVVENNPANLLAVAFDNGHLFFAKDPAVFRWLSDMVGRTGGLANGVVLAAQALAIAAFFLPKRGLLILLAVFDVMHLSIIVVAGANFWPWIFLNVAIGAVVASRHFVMPRPALAFGAAVFILLSSKFASVAYLGWYDTLANNKVFFLAEDSQGRRHYVPTNYFTFYSYPMSHMDYGFPEPQAAFAVGSPNGGSFRYRQFQAGLTCDVGVLTEPLDIRPISPGLDGFVRNYHALALGLEARIGELPYDLYPHHFYVGSWLGRDFAGLEKRDIRAYIYRRESVCLTRAGGSVERRLISSAEHRIDVR